MIVSWHYSEKKGNFTKEESNATGFTFMEDKTENVCRNCLTKEELKQMEDEWIGDPITDEHEDGCKDLTCERCGKNFFPDFLEHKKGSSRFISKQRMIRVEKERSK